MRALLQPPRLLLFAWVLRAIYCLCPDGFYLSLEHQGSCQACPACPAPSVWFSPCGPGPDQGACGSGIRVELSIGNASGVNLTVALAQFSGGAYPAVDATALDVVLQPCPTAEEFRSLVDLLCHPCQACRAPVPVEAAPCVTEHDRVCIPPIAAMIQVNGTDLVLQPDVLLALLAAFARNGFNASFSTATYDQVYPVRIACPPDHYRSGASGACAPCSACPPLTLESAPCTPDADRACDTALVAGFLLGSAPFTASLGGDWNLSLFQVGPDGDALPVPSTPCPAGQFRSPLDAACHACATACDPDQIQLRACSPAGDRICAVVEIDLAALEAAGVNTTRLNQTQLRAVIGAALAASQPFPLPAQLPLAPAHPPRLGVAPLPCQPGFYLSLSSLTCAPCSPCPQGQYQLSACTADSDAAFRACRACDVLDNVLSECSPAGDRVCGGSMGIQVFVGNSTALNRSLLLNELLGQLLVALPEGSAVDPSYLVHWQAVLAVVAGAYAGYDMQVAPLACAAGQYADPSAQACQACSACAASAYTVAPCTNVSDTVCARCATCVAGQYEACPCGGGGNASAACPSSGDRLCYAYTGLNVTVNATLLAQYSAADLEAAYLPGVRADMRRQTLAAEVELLITGSAPFTDGVALANRDGTVNVYYGAPPVQHTLYPIAGLAPAPGGVLRHTLLIRLAGLYALQPNAERDYSVLVERALRTTEAYLVPAAALASQNASGPGARRLLQDAPSCPSDSYPAAYPLLGTLCVPCQNDPVLMADASTPPALRWQLAAAPCPMSYARYCPGGNAPPQCVVRFAGSLLLSATGSDPTQLACPAGQAVAVDPATLGPLCVGIPCGPGFAGVPGFCAPCDPGTYKAVVGTAACTPCPAGTYAPAGGAASLSACLPCGNHSDSLPGAANCTCDAGYAGQACAPCAQGTYKFLPGDGPCAPCESGGYSPSTAGLHCLACPGGAFADLSGLSACLACAAGTYQNATGASRCSPCAPGYISRPTPPRTDCQGCPGGAYTPAPAYTACLSCAAGAYSPPRASACATCPNGTSSGARAQTCQPCPAGAYGQLGLCAPCPVNTYAPAPSAAACAPCPPGLATAAAGASSLAQCLPCAPNFYWDALGCLPCPPNTAAPAGGLSSRDCLAAPGYYGLPGQRALACPAGSYCPQASMAPSKCPDGSSSEQGSRTCTVIASASVVHQFDGIVATSWFVVTFLGVGCLARTRRFWRSRPP